MSIGPDNPVWAAGAVPLRGSGKAREVVIVHRPAYDDWTLPKGKAHPSELLPTTAVREVAEESSSQIRLSAPLTPLRYPIGQATKYVSWWVGTTLSWAPHIANPEVDRAQWVSPNKALKTLTYSDERDILTEAVSLPDTTPLIILRHAKALRREDWNKNDALRPLSSRGRDQLPYVDQVLRPFGIKNVVSSTSARCVQTVHAYARTIKAEVTTVHSLCEEKATHDEVSAYMARLAKAVGASGIPTVVCGHRPVIPFMLDPLDIHVRPMATASCVIAHLDARGTVVRTEWHDTLRVKM
ncbi:MAG: NUDIX hydrolase [Propionibacteriaceae bacterium]|nr:NUDIX hydrolase [Propionibacteriaceae bacterium]